MSQFSLRIVANDLIIKDFWQPVLDLIVVRKIPDAQLKHDVVQSHWQTSDCAHRVEIDRFVVYWNWNLSLSDTVE